VHDSIHGRFTHRHGYLHDVFVVETGFVAMRPAVSSALFTVSSVESNVKETRFPDIGRTVPGSHCPLAPRTTTAYPAGQKAVSGRWSSLPVERGKVNAVVAISPLQRFEGNTLPGLYLVHLSDS